MLESLERTMRNVMDMTWPMIVVSVLCITSIRLVYLIKNKEKFVFYREVLMLFFIIYILCLFQVVTFQDVSSHGGTSNFSLFTEIFRYRFGSRLFLKNVIGNMLLFIPYGFFVSYYVKPKKIWLPFFLTLFASLSIETTQLLIGRVFDVDDILLNVLGGLIGYSIYLLIAKIRSYLPEFFQKPWLLNIASVLLIALFVGYIYMVVL